MLRIHFTAEDLARTRVATSPWPFAEALFATRLLSRRDGRGIFDGWRRLVRRRLSPHTRLLGQLYPGQGPVLDLFTVVGPNSSLEASVERLLSAPRTQLRHELAGLNRGDLPTRATDLAAGDPAALTELAAAIREVDAVAVGPSQHAIAAHLDAVNAVRGRDLCTGGVEQLLTGLHHSVVWRSPVLHISDEPNKAHDYHLKGQGLIAIPSLFCWPSPRYMCNSLDEAAPGLLFYPAVDTLSDFADAWAPPGRGPRVLQALLGRTRAAVLETAADAATTSEIARRLDISLPSASQHATALRDAGLLTSRRTGPAVHHTLTRLGRELLEGRPAEQA
ncbi:MULTISPECIES: ArsR/SmtB family transcription factor [Nonomuraea]|uniref:ArsR/SmtB family transcription factor n=1 Tax=Nonomuraea mangrovi TaxID=2316207 RepID=A0ABW4T257_9ACTN